MITKHNTSILGYDSLSDATNTIFGLKFYKANILLSVFGGLSSFITSYIYNDARAVYILGLLLFTDFLTGVLRAAKLNRFSSARLPRIALTAVVYCGLLALSWNLSNILPVYSFLPGAVYFVFVSTLMKSLVENLKDLGLLPKQVFTAIKKLLKKD